MSEELKQTQTADTETDAGYEKLDINLKSIGAVSLIGIIMVATIFVMLNLYFSSSKEKQIYNSVLKPESMTARDLRAQEAEVLGAYKVLDAAKGIYQIPIERAMELVANEAYEGKSKATPAVEVKKPSKKKKK